MLGVSVWGWGEGEDLGVVLGLVLRGGVGFGLGLVFRVKDRGLVRGKG